MPFESRVAGLVDIDSHVIPSHIFQERMQGIIREHV